jgi:hypothetical protein
MLRVYVRIAYFVVFLIVIDCTTMIALGSSQSSHPALFDYGHCPSECWFQITPGHTTSATAHEFLTSRGYQSTSDDEYFRHYYSRPNTEWFCFIDLYSTNGIVIIMTLRVCDTLRVGDFMRVLGNPERIVYLSQNRETILSFGTNKIVIQESSLSMHSLVARVEFYSPRLANRTAGWLWRGFVPLWQYQQLEVSRPSS